MKKTTSYALLAIFLMGLPPIVYAGEINLPKTGQTTCYNDVGAVIACPGTGQDGDTQAGIAWPSPRFTNHGDGTVTDNLTGLMWMANGNYAGDRLEWKETLNELRWVNDGTYPNFGYNDWRLPNINELESLVNYGASDPAAWLNTQGFFNAQAGNSSYWSSTMDVQFPNSLAWAIRFLDGRSESLPLSGTGDGRNYVWLVRSGQTSNPDPNYPSNVWKTGQTINYYPTDDGYYQMGVTWPVPRFTDNGDTVTDNLTGLMWLKDTNCIYSQYPGFDLDPTVGDGAVSWLNAMNFVAGINNGTYTNCSGGYNDWRVPNVKELRSLLDYSQALPAVPPGHPFIGSGGNTAYWSSTTKTWVPDSAWTVDLYHAAVTEDLKEGGFFVFYNVLPVRGPSVPDVTIPAFASAYGAVNSEPNYSSVCDMDSDGDVDGGDLVEFLAGI